MCGLRHVAEGGRRSGAGERRLAPPRLRTSWLSSRKPRAVWLMVPAAVVDKSIADLVPHLERGDILIDGGNSYYVDDIRRAQELASKGINYVDVGTRRRRVGPGARLLHDDRRPGGGLCGILIRSSRCSPRVREISRARPAARRSAAPPSSVYLALRGKRRRSLRQDGPQRHRVRHHGRLCRGDEHSAPRQCGRAAAGGRTPRRHRCAIRSFIATISTCATLQKCGGAAAYIALLAARPHRNRR